MVRQIIDIDGSASNRPEDRLGHTVIKANTPAEALARIRDYLLDRADWHFRTAGEKGQSTREVETHHAIGEELQQIAESISDMRTRPPPGADLSSDVHR